VNDGSRDRTADTLAILAAKRPWLKVINLKRRSGQTAAMMAGFEYTQGKVIVTMDGDLQNDPADIGRLLAKLEEGFDVVSGWRVVRQDHRIRRVFLSRVANALISFATGVRLHDFGCTLKAYRREILEDVRLYGEMHRFIPVYASWNGAKIAELPVNHSPRKAGSSNYGLSRLVKVVLDLLVVVFLHRYAQKPIYVFGTCGLVSMAISALAGAAMIYYKFWGGKTFIETPLPLLWATMFFTGVLCLLLGLIAEMNMRIYHESQGKRTYRILSLINLPRKPADSATASHLAERSDSHDYVRRLD
jgi:glycosyltransferase involved in cell wall biosynthesis